MKSRSCYAIAASSFLLLGACPSGEKGDSVDADPVVQTTRDVKADEKKADEKKAESKEEAHGQQYSYSSGGGVGEDEGTDSGEPVVEDTGEEAAEDTGADASAPPTKDGCKRGHMKFEGKCLSKERVSKILETRDEAVKEKVQTAKDPKEQAEASYDLLEQQIAHMDKTEDDLDEILEQLRLEQLEREAKKKEAEGDKKHQ